LRDDDVLNFSDGFRNSIAAGALRLGDAWCGAFAEAGGTASERMRHMTLLGDPSLCISATRTARGTPTSWLIAEGLTNNPSADLDDPDKDGFATWQEYQAGTPYLENVLRIRGFSANAASAGGSSLTFESMAGLSYRVVSTTNLVSGVWAPVPWKAAVGDVWSWSGILADWPVETVVVPFEGGEGARFYKVESYEP